MIGELVQVFTKFAVKTSGSSAPDPSSEITRSESVNDLPAITSATSTRAQNSLQELKKIRFHDINLESL